MHVFTYGTLMFGEMMKALTGRTFPTVPASVQGYKRIKLKGENFPGLIPMENERTHGIIHRDVDPESFKLIDALEDDFYDRSVLEIRGDNGEFYRALTYVINQPSLPFLTLDSWDPDEFKEKHFQDFKKLCEKTRKSFQAAQQ